MTPSGIEPATFRFVAQHLNHCATAVPLIYDIPCISSFGWPDDGSESKHVVVSIILCNKLLCLTETYILYELDKHIGMTAVKKWFIGNGLSFNRKEKLK